jgi:perosamine synthetase
MPAYTRKNTSEMTRRNCFAYALVFDEADMDAFIFTARLRDKDVDTRPFFLSMHQLPAHRARWLFQGFRLPVMEGLRRRGLYLPSGASSTEAQINSVAGAVKDVLK